MQSQEPQQKFYASTRSLYNQSNMKDLIGMSNCKIMDGEDLSKLLFMFPLIQKGYGDRKRL